MRRRVRRIWVAKKSVRRLFLAIPLPADWTRTLTGYQDRLKTSGMAGRIRTVWTDPANFHITVRFIGNVDESCIGGLTALLREISGHVTGFALPFDRMTVETPGEPKMIWARFTVTDAFRTLVGSCTDEAGRYLLNRCGMKLENGHDIIPHVTVARFKGNPGFRDPLPGLPESPGVLSVHTLRLVSSETRPQGSLYTTVAVFRLQERGRG